jgi:RNA binding activity-knot of a chromodomain
MTTYMIPLFSQTTVFHAFGLQILALLLCVPTIIAVVGILAGSWTKVQKLRLDNALKQQMIDRGMSAEDIVAVLTSSTRGQEGLERPCASEVVVESEGEWHTGLILKREGERYYVHYVGTDMSDNEWVTSDRIRVPASNESECGAPWDWAFAAGSFAASNRCGTGQKVKAAPVDQDI